MIPIIEFSWQDFSLTQVSNVSVGQLYDMAQQYQPELFMFHDPGSRASALVVPEVVIQTVDGLGLPHEEPATEVGLLDLLRRDQITVDRDQPASLVVKMAAWQDAQVVIVVDNAAVPLGLFIPSVEVQEFPNRGFIWSDASPELRQIVARLSAVGDLVGVVCAIESHHSSFHSESGNAQSRSPYTCEDHGLAHKRSRCPCDLHPNATCARRIVRA